MEAMNKVPTRSGQNSLNPYQNLAQIPTTRPQQQLVEEKSPEEVISQAPQEKVIVPKPAEEGVIVMQNLQDQLLSIIEREEVEDVIDLNEKFLSLALGVDTNDLAIMTKIELRVDSRHHNLQVTGEIMPQLDLLKLNDSVISCFRDIGTSFKNVRVLHIARCEIREVQGIQAFKQLNELYISYN